MERRAGRRSSSFANLRTEPHECPPPSPPAPWPDGHLTAPDPEAATAGDLPEPGALNGEGSLRQRTDAERGQGPGAEDSKGTPQGRDSGRRAGGRAGAGWSGLRGEVKRRGRLSPRAAGFYAGRRALTADLSTSKAPGRWAPSRDKAAPELGGRSELPEASSGAHASTHLAQKELQRGSPTSNRAGAGRGRGRVSGEDSGRQKGREDFEGVPGEGTPGSCALCQGQLPCGDRAQRPTPDVHIYPSPDPSPHPKRFQAFCTRPSRDPGTSLIINNVLFQGESPGLGCNTTHVLKAKTQLGGWSGARERAVFC